MKVVIVGAGGHARSVLWALRSRGEQEAVACTDPDLSRHGKDLDGVVIVGGDDRLPDLRNGGVDGAVLGVGGVADNKPRESLFELVSELGFALPTIMHASAVVAASSDLGQGTVVLAGAVVGPNVLVGKNAVVNTGALLEHDTFVEDHAHVASGAVLAGGVRVGRGAHIGASAVILQGVRIGSDAVVGAGAVVLNDVTPGSVVAGVPARVTRRPSSS